MAAKWRVRLTPTAADDIRHLPPLANVSVKALLKSLGLDPSIGKALQQELVGYYSARFQRWRVIYSMMSAHRMVTVYLIAHRSSVYEAMRRLLQTTD